MGSLFGGIAGVAAIWWARLRTLWRLTRRLEPMTAQQRAVVWRVVDVVESPAFPVAVQAVQRTATTLGFNRNDAWSHLKSALKVDPGHAENTFRHLQTVQTLRLNYTGSSLSNPEAHLLVELAYHGYAWQGGST